MGQEREKHCVSFSCVALSVSVHCELQWREALLLRTHAPRLQHNDLPNTGGTQVPTDKHKHRHTGIRRTFRASTGTPCNNSHFTRRLPPFSTAVWRGRRFWEVYE